MIRREVSHGTTARRNAGMRSASLAGSGACPPHRSVAIDEANSLRLEPGRSASSNVSSAELDDKAKRWAAVMATHGMWKDDPTKPKDAVAYQREVRAEWR